MRTLFSRGAVALSAVGLAAIVVLTGCSSPSTPAGAGGAGGEKSDISALSNHDCFNAPRDSEVSAVLVVDCSGDHDNEVYARFALIDNFFGSTPYDDVLARGAAEGQCLPAFEKFVGSANGSTSLQFSFSYPTAQRWEDNDTAIRCFVFSPRGQISGSLENKGPEHAVK